MILKKPVSLKYVPHLVSTSRESSFFNILLLKRAGSKRNYEKGLNKKGAVKGREGKRVRD